MPNSPASEEQVEQVDEEQGRPTEEPELQDRFDKLDDRYKRALADLDNYRKRSAKETERRVTEARDAAVRDWLEAVDSVERALLLGPDAGMTAVLEQMNGILERFGVERIAAAGQPFDPSLHEAIAVRETGEAPPQTVLDVARAGYHAGDRVLRPAQVVVARPPSD
jgi:molecular chaperone GrpE